MVTIILVNLLTPIGIIILATILQFVVMILELPFIAMSRGGNRSFLTVPLFVGGLLVEFGAVYLCSILLSIMGLALPLTAIVIAAALTLMNELSRVTGAQHRIDRHLSMGGQPGDPESYNLELPQFLGGMCGFVAYIIVNWPLPIY